MSKEQCKSGLMFVMAIAIVVILAMTFAEGVWAGIRVCFVAVCIAAIANELTKRHAIGRPIPWQDVEEGASFWVIQEMENNQFLVKFWPGDVRHIVGYPGLYGVRGWHAKSGERARSVKDPWPSSV